LHKCVIGLRDLRKMFFKAIWIAVLG